MSASGGCNALVIRLQSMAAQHSYNFIRHMHKDSAPCSLSHPKFNCICGQFGNMLKLSTDVLEYIQLDQLQHVNKPSRVHINRSSTWQGEEVGFILLQKLHDAAQPHLQL
jgi:hypothetical protein